MNKFKRTLLFTVLGAMTFALPGCGEEEKKPVNITLLCDFEGTEIERHESAQFTFTVENAEAAEVSYAISSDVATITEDGKMTVKDDAKVGTEFVVYAQLGDIKSNNISFKVTDTMPTDLRLVADAKTIKENNEIHFGATFVPTYATVKEYTVAAVGENAGLVEVTNNVLKLKAGVSYVENLEKVVKVRATLNADPNVFGETELTIGEVVGSIDVENVNLIVKQSKSYKVKPVLYGNDGAIITPSLDYGFVSSDESVFKVSKFGEITPVGHGSATLTVTYGDKAETATVNIIMSADSIEVNGANKTTLGNGMYYGKGDAFPLSIKNTFNTEKYGKVSEKYNFAFKLIDAGTKEILATGDDVATIDAENNITFKTTGKVQMDVTTDSSINDVLVPAEYEETTTFFFNVNEGVNVHDYTEMAAALENSNIDVINFINDVEVTAANVKREGGVGSATRYAGINSRGDKHLYGNGYEIDLTTLELDPYMDDVDDDGADFIKFAPAVGKEHEPFTVQMYDLTLYGNTDFNGYNAKVDDPMAYTNPANYAHWAFNKHVKYAKSFRTGFRVGYANEKVGFLDKNGVVKEEEFNGAYIKDFKMNNVTIRGFYWGLWTSHVIGSTENFYVYDSVEKGVLNAQSQLTMHNTKFGRVGGFATEISLDGVNDQGNIGAETHYPTAGADYHQKPFINLTGSISVDNPNSGSDTLYMWQFNDQLASLPEAQALSIHSTNELIEMVFNNVYAYGIALEAAGGNAELANAYTAELSAFWKTLLLKNNQLNFFNLAFMFELGLSGEGNQTADYYATYEEQGSAVANLMTEMTNYMLAKASGAPYTGYKAYEFIAADILIPGQMYVGKVVLSNYAYDPTYVPNVQ